MSPITQSASVGPRDVAVNTEESRIGLERARFSISFFCTGHRLAGNCSKGCKFQKIDSDLACRMVSDEIFCQDEQYVVLGHRIGLHKPSSLSELIFVSGAIC